MIPCIDDGLRLELLPEQRIAFVGAKMTGQLALVEYIREYGDSGEVVFRPTITRPYNPNGDNMHQHPSSVHLMEEEPDYDSLIFPELDLPSSLRAPAIDSVRTVAREISWLVARTKGVVRKDAQEMLKNYWKTRANEDAIKF